MYGFFYENCDIDILDNGRIINDFIGNKIKEFGLGVIIRDIMIFMFF